MGVIARRRPLPGNSARYVRAVLWRGLDTAAHSEGKGDEMAGGRRGRGVVPISARPVNGDRIVTIFLSLFLSFPMDSSLKRLSIGLVLRRV